ncbi:MAG: ATP synthase subunit I [Lachnospiraceae bacterium]|nr:ATP synthase subunit I [Lachnospiraceae bacterium]
MIKDFLRRMNRTAKELICGILIFGAVIWLIFIWLASDKWSFTLGLALGVAAAMLLAVHMNYSIEQSLELTEKDAAGYMRRMVLLRTGMVVLLFAVVCLLRFGNPLAVFAGLFTLKLGAYFQPVLHRLIEKKR